MLSADQVRKMLEEYGRLPRLPDGRINFENSRTAPVIACFVEKDGKLLLLQRSRKVGTHKGKWNNISGYIDEERALKELVLRELREETGIRRKHIKAILFGDAYEHHDKQVGKLLTIFPVMVKLKGKPQIKLNWEHVEHKWVLPAELEAHDVVPSTLESLRRLRR